MSQETTNKLTELKFLSGQLESMDSFASLYDKMITDCRLSDDKTMARAM